MFKNHLKKVKKRILKVVENKRKELIYIYFNRILFSF